MYKIGGLDANSTGYLDRWESKSFWWCRECWKTGDYESLSFYMYRYLFSTNIVKHLACKWFLLKAETWIRSSSSQTWSSMSNKAPGPWTHSYVTPNLSRFAEVRSDSSLLVVRTSNKTDNPPKDSEETFAVILVARKILRFRQIFFQNWHRGFSEEGIIKKSSLSEF